MIISIIIIIAIWSMINRNNNDNYYINVKHDLFFPFANDKHVACTMKLYNICRVFYVCQTYLHNNIHMYKYLNIISYITSRFP